MTQVKCLTEAQKDEIVYQYQGPQESLVDIAEHFCTSTRTVGRVLEERGLALPVQRLKGQGYIAVKALEKHDIRAEELDVILSRSTSYHLAEGFIARANQEQITGLMVAINDRINALCQDARADDTRQLELDLQDMASDTTLPPNDSRTALIEMLRNDPNIAVITG